MERAETDEFLSDAAELDVLTGEGGEIGSFLDGLDGGVTVLSHDDRILSAVTIHVSRISS